MKSLLIDVYRREVDIVDCSIYPDAYKLLNCSTYDIPFRAIGFENRVFGIVVDDEGLLKNNQIVSAVSPHFEEIFVGNLLITRFDEEGNQIDLSDDDINYLNRYIVTGAMVNDGIVDSYPILTGMSYDCYYK